MMNFKLLNFDHGNNYPSSFSIGPFKVEITKQHCRNLIHLPRNESITFGWDKDFNRAIKRNPKIRGSWIETAEVIIDDKDIKPSVIFPETASKNSIDDLCLFLSFISGRVVTLENNPFIDHLNPEEHADKVVHYGYFLRNNFTWNNLSILRNQGFAGQFYYLTMAYQSQDFVAKAVHYNNALNVAYDKWYHQNPIKFIDKKIRSEIRSSIQKCLNEHNAEVVEIKEDVINDVINRVDNICNPSATFKLKLFLRGIDLYPKYELSEMHKRLTWLNLVRNSMAHTGMLPKDKKLPEDLLGDVTSSIIELVLRINQYYFGKVLLRLDDPYLNFIKKLIMPYFYEGKFCGRLIFTEKYEEYMERAKKEWISGYN
jgi:hypothetical protein